MNRKRNRLTIQRNAPSHGESSWGAWLLSRYSGAILLGCLFAFPAILYGAARTIGTNSNRIADWLPANLPESVQLKQFDLWFGGGQFVVVSWEGCQIDIDPASNNTQNDHPRLNNAITSFGSPTLPV